MACFEEFLQSIKLSTHPEFFKCAGQIPTYNVPTLLPSSKPTESPEAFFSCVNRLNLGLSENSSVIFLLI